MSTEQVPAESITEKLGTLNIVDNDAKEKTEEKRPHRPRLTDEERRQMWEEKQAKKEVLETGVKGTVKWYSVRGKFGFIAREDGQQDVFVHQTAISKSSINRYFLRTLADEEQVEFDVVQGDKGPEAANVSGPEGADVKGSKYYHVLIRRVGHRNGGNKKTAKRENGAKSDDKEENENDEKDAEKKSKKKPRNKRNQRKPKDGKKEEDGKSEGESEEEVAEKAGRRRTSDGDKMTKVNSPKGSGDAAGLGADVLPSAAIH